MTDYCDKIQANTHQSRHYESCLNSTCSRSPSPVRRQLWEPKHPPPEKLKSNKTLDTTKQTTNNTRSRDRSPFLPPRNINGTTTPNRSQDPLFTYTIDQWPVDGDNGTKHFELRIQKHFDSTPPSSGRKTPELSIQSSPPTTDQVAAGNSKLKLELDTSRVPPIITIIKNNLSNAQQTVQLAASTPPTTCTTSCHYSSSCCTQPYPCSPKQNTGPCDVMCQACPCPYLSSPRINLKEDKATSPIKPLSRTPPELEPSCISVCQICPKLCPYSSSSTTKEDKALAPINPCSRSGSPCPQQNSSPNSIDCHDCHSSDISSRGTIEIKFDEGSKLHVDWKDDVGPVKVGFPVTSLRDQRSRSADQVHSYNPQLEAFYTSSCNQSGSPSPRKSRSISPSSQLSEGQRSRSIVPCAPGNPCSHNNPSSFNEARLKSSCPSRSPCSPSTSYSRSPKSKSLSKKALSKNNSFGSLERYTEDGDIITNIDWSSSILNVDTHNQFSKPNILDCKIKDHNSDIKQQQSLSPVLTLTPPAGPNGQMTIEWSPRLADERRYEMGPLVVKKEPVVEGDYIDLVRSCHHNDVGEEDRESHPEVILPAPKHLTSPNADLEYKTFMQAKDLTCISTCNPPCTFAGCVPRCDPCEGSQGHCDGCCYCYSEDCVAPIEGVNRCTSLPPHLQSDWSASLCAPPGVLRTKPILYRDTQGHEHIMFSDGSIEHLSRHCEPITSIPSQFSKPPPPRATNSSSCAMTCSSPPLSTPSYCQHLSHHEEQNFDQYCASNFSPQSGDIVIRAHQRLPCMYPGKDNGQVAFFTSDYLDLQKGDSIVRLGKFDNSGQWCSSKVVEMYLRGSHGRWLFLGTTEGHSVLYPLEADQHQVVQTPNKQLKLRQGDLVISTIPSPNSFYFWNPRERVEIDHSHLLLRAYIGHPQVVDEHHNLACCVPGHLPVGYVELYVKVKRIWLFLGRDDHMFSDHELMHFS